MVGPAARDLGRSRGPILPTGGVVAVAAARWCSISSSRSALTAFTCRGAWGQTSRRTVRLLRLRYRRDRREPCLNSTVSGLRKTMPLDPAHNVEMTIWGRARAAICLTLPDSDAVRCRCLVPCARKRDRHAGRNRAMKDDNAKRLQSQPGVAHGETPAISTRSGRRSSARQPRRLSLRQRCRLERARLRRARGARAPPLRPSPARNCMAEWVEALDRRPRHHRHSQRVPRPQRDRSRPTRISGRSSRKSA